MDWIDTQSSIKQEEAIKLHFNKEEQAFAGGNIDKIITMPQQIRPQCEELASPQKSKGLLIPPKCKVSLTSPKSIVVNVFNVTAASSPVPMDFFPEENVALFRAQCAKKWGYDPRKVRLLFLGHFLEDGVNMSKYEIQNQDQIQLSLAL